MYYKVLAAAVIILFGAWIIGAILGSRKLEKACIVALVLLVTGAALVWVLTGIPPVPRWVTRSMARLFHW